LTVPNIWNCGAATNLRGIIPEIRTGDSAAFSGTKTARPRARKLLAKIATNAIQ
jgi:hypothetical protein